MESVMDNEKFYCIACRRYVQHAEVDLSRGGCVGTRPDGQVIHQITCLECVQGWETLASCPQEHRPANLFDAWSSLNEVMCDSRMRFDALREFLPKCTTLQEARALLNYSGFGQRYPLLPDSLPVTGWVRVSRG